MLEQYELAAILSKHSKFPVNLPGGMAQLEPLLQQAWASGRKQWPDVYLRPETFVTHLARHWRPPSEDISHEDQLERQASPDLYLACACTEGIPEAIAAFKRHYLSIVPAKLGSRPLTPTELDDVRQDMCEMLFAGTPKAPPKIATYSGRGPLRGWVRKIARNATVDMLRKLGVPVVDDGDEIVAALEARPEFDPELELSKRETRAQLRSALEDAFAALSKNQQLLMRLYLIDGLSTTKIARLFDVDQSTIWRWLRVAMQQIRKETRRRLGLSSNEFKSFLRGIGSQFDLTFSDLLKMEDDEDEVEDAIVVP